MNYNLPNFSNTSYIEDSVNKFTKWYKLEQQYDLKGNSLLVTRHLYTNKNRLNTGVCIGFKVITNLTDIYRIKITNINNTNDTYIFNNLKNNDIIWFQNTKVNNTRSVRKYFDDIILNNALECSYNSYYIITPENVYLECYFINSLEERQIENKDTIKINTFCFPFDTDISFQNEVNYSLSFIKSRPNIIS
jgi:hypothetical protein